MSDPIQSAPLINPRNMCYINASLQILYQVLYFDGDLPPHGHDDPMEVISCWRCKLYSTLRTMRSSVGIPMVPEIIFNLIREMGQENPYDLKYLEQSDTFSFMALMFDRCNLEPFRRIFRLYNSDTGEVGLESTGYSFMLLLDYEQKRVRSIQDLFDESLLDRDSNVIERIETPPEFACLYLKRFVRRQIVNERHEIIGQYDKKLKKRVAISKVLSMQLTDNTIVRYDILGTINHSGATIQGGHYITYLKSRSGWHQMEDHHVHEDVLRIKSKETYVVFYKKRSAEMSDLIDEDVNSTSQSSESDFSDEEMDTTLPLDRDGMDNLYDEDENLPNCSSSANKITSPTNHDNMSTSDNEDHEEMSFENRSPFENDQPFTNHGPRLVLNDDLVNATNQELSTIVGVSQVWSALRKWKILMFLPKNVVGSKNNFCERFLNLGTNLGDGEIHLVLYTISYNNSLTMEMLLRDEFLASHFDAYEMYLLKGIGFGKIDHWLACVFIGHILYSRYVSDRNGVKFDFIFNFRQRGLVPKIIKDEYQKARTYALEFLTSIIKNDLFCVTSCRPECNIVEAPHHLNLINMKPVDYFDPQVPTIIESYFLRWNSNLDIKHPLYPLLCFENIEVAANEIDDNFSNVIQQLDIRHREWMGSVVYCFLIVTPLDGTRASASDLFNHCLNKSAIFKTYAGMTTNPQSIQAGHRMQHFQNLNSTQSSVYDALYQNSTVYKFFSSNYEQSKGKEVESAWIEILLASKDRSDFLHDSLLNTIANRRRERSAFFGSEDSLQKNVKLFLETNQKLFIFQGDNDHYEPLEMEIEGCYLINDDMEVKIEQCVRNQLPRIN